MKTTTLLTLLVVFCLASCDNFDFSGNAENTELTALKLSPESLEYLDFYEHKNTIVLSKVAIPDDHTLNVSIPSISKKNSEQRELWVMEKQGPTAVKFEQNSIGINGVYTRGDYETRKITYVDNRGNKVKIILDMEQRIFFDSEEWERISENFVITYDDPCTDTYINFRTKYFESKLSNKRDETILMDQLVVGSKIYYDVMRLKIIGESSHYAFYATKAEGIIRIDDLDHDEVWIAVTE